MWKSVLAGVTGSSHEKTKQPCQDYGTSKFLDDQDLIIAGAIADGMGSAKHSDEGSKLAVETALSLLEEIEPKDWLKGFSEEEAKTTFDWVIKKVQYSLKQEAENKEYLLHDLACTLLVFVATSKYIMAMQIGDGFIVIRSGKNKEYRLLFQPHQDGAIDVTISITSSQAINEMQVCVIDDVCDFICSGTDGLEYIALKFQRITDCQPKLSFFEQTRQLVIQTKQEEAREQINKFLVSEKVRKKSDDDKTLLVCVRTDVVIQELPIDTGDSEQNNGNSHGTNNPVNEDDSSSQLVNNTSSQQEEVKQKELKAFPIPKNQSTNTNSPSYVNSSTATPKVGSSNFSDENNTDSVNDEDNSVTDESESTEKEATESESEINNSKEDVLKGLSITVNVLTIPLIFFLLYKLRQPVIPIYAIPNLNIPTNEQWVIISGDRLDKNKMIFEVKKNDFAPVYRNRIDAKNPEFNYPVQFLQPNTYYYTKTEAFNPNVSNSKRQWVKIENSPCRGKPPCLPLPLSLSAWAIASIDHLNTREMSFTVEESDPRVIYRGDWTPSNKPDSKYRLGELPPGTYRYTEVKLFDAKNSEDKKRWVKIQIKKP